MNTNYLTVSHGGHSGDIVYSIPLVNHLASLKNVDIRYVIINDRMAEFKPGVIHPNGSTIMNRNAIEFIKPLLLAIPSISEVLEMPSKNLSPDCFPLDFFRDIPTVDLGQGSIALWTRKFLGISLDTENAWLNFKKLSPPGKKIVCAFSRRYRNASIDYNFLNSIDDVSFVGLPDEFQNFISTHKLNSVKYLPTHNSVELAEVIASSDLFIGNQSFPFSIAEGLKVNRALEVCELCPNVIPSGHGAFDYLNNAALNNILRINGFDVQNNSDYGVCDFKIYI
jgi:hypothetical protein